MSRKSVSALAVFLSLLSMHVQAAVNTFQYRDQGNTYTIPGSNPANGGVTTIPTVLVPIALSFESKPVRLDAAANVSRVLRSPIFRKAVFPHDRSQYLDAMLRAAFPGGPNWHTLLGQPEIRPVRIAVPAADGYVLNSKKTGRSIAVVDVEYVQREVFKRIPRQDGKLVVAITHNTAFYTEGDATLCCSWGTHGIDTATGNSFVLGSYLSAAPAVVEDRDIQPLTQQLAEFAFDPTHDPLAHVIWNQPVPGNRFPPWMRTASEPAASADRCAGTGAGSAYFLLEPTDTNAQNNFPVSRPFAVRAGGAVYHVEQAALLPWYIGAKEGLGAAMSFPDAAVLAEPARPCPASRPPGAPPPPAAEAMAQKRAPNGHQLIGYWAGYGRAGSMFPLREISPQWDVILVAFAIPDKTAPEGTMLFRTPAGFDTAQFKADIAWLKSQGKKVMISLGGGGQHFTLAHAASVPNYVESVTRIVREFGFDGIDVDFESPSLSIDAGDRDFRHPTTPSIVNLIDALRQLHQRFGPDFLVSLVPEGTQIPAGLGSYGGQFGSYLPIVYAIRDFLTFVDVQDYNTPPLEGLDGEIHQPGTADYHTAMTELLLHGFNMGGDRRQSFPPLAANKVAVGFLVEDTTPQIVSQSMDFLIRGKAPAGSTYKLRQTGGYPAMRGAMFWTIDGDRRGNYNFSNVIGPQLHAYPTPQEREAR